jgi:hypothetical protein
MTQNLGQYPVDIFDAAPNLNNLFSISACEFQRIPSANLSRASIYYKGNTVLKSQFNFGCRAFISRQRYYHVSRQDVDVIAAQAILAAEM